MDDKDVVDVKAVRESLKNFNFSTLFIEQLGWNRPNQMDGSVKVKQEGIPYSYIAQISGVPILRFQGEFWGRFKKKSERKTLHGEIKKRHEKNLLVFSDEKTFFSLSYLNKDGSVKVHDYFKGQNGDAIIGKLAGIHIGIDAEEPSICEISEKLNPEFDSKFLRIL